MSVRYRLTVQQTDDSWVVADHQTWVDGAYTDPVAACRAATMDVDVLAKIWRRWVGEHESGAPPMSDAVLCAMAEQEARGTRT